MPTAKRFWLFSLLIALAGNPVSAQHQHHDHQDGSNTLKDHDHGAHVHGTGELLLVLEGEQLDIELLSPAMNLLGFEHPTSSSEDQDTVIQAKAILADGNKLFQLDAARCLLIDHETDFSGVEGHTRFHKDTHKHGHKHTDVHPKDNDQHSNITAHYHYRCKQADQLDSLSTTIPMLFPGIQVLEVQWIVNGRQGAATLDNSQRQLIFR